MSKHREHFPHTSLPKVIDDAIPVLGLAVCCVLAVVLIGLGKI